METAKKNEPAASRKLAANSSQLVVTIRRSINVNPYLLADHRQHQYPFRDCGEGGHLPCFSPGIS
jgi:hypothetical protein